MCVRRPLKRKRREAHRLLAIQFVRIGCSRTPTTPNAHRVWTPPKNPRTWCSASYGTHFATRWCGQRFECAMSCLCLLCVSVRLSVSLGARWAPDVSTYASCCTFHHTPPHTTHTTHPHAHT